MTGLASLVPWAWYQVPHFLRTWRKPLSHHLVLGWAAAVLLLAAMVSGVWVTAEAALGTRITPIWQRVHLASGLASFALVLAHALVAALRPLGGFSSSESSRAWWRSAGSAVAGLGIAAAAGALLTRPSTAAEFPAGYRRPFGDSPFAPSLARTASGGAVNQEALSGSASKTRKRSRRRLSARFRQGGPQ